MSIAETITLKDEVSGPAGAAASAVGKLASAFARLGNAMTKANTAAAAFDAAKFEAMSKAVTEAETAKKGAAAKAVADAKADAAKEVAAAKAVHAQEAQAQKAAQAQQAQAQKAHDQARQASHNASNQAVLAAQKAAHQREAAAQKAATDAEKAKTKATQDTAKAAERTAAAAERAARAPAPRAVAGGGRGGGSGAGAIGGMGGGGGGAMSGALAGAGAAGAVAAALMTIAGFIQRILSAGMDLTMAGAKMAVEAAGFRMNTMVGLKMILGTQAAADEAYQSIKKFANETPFETDFVTNLYKSLAAAGYKAAEIKDILKGTFDVAALKNFSTESAQSIVGALLKVKSVGKLTAESLETISVASGAVVNIQTLAETLAKTKNVSVAVAKQMIQGGKLGADEATKAIMETIRTKVSGGELGKLAKELGEGSVIGLASTISGQFKDLFELIDIKPIIGLMKKIAEYMDPGNAIGKGLKEGLESVFSGLFEMVFGSMDKGDVAKTVLTDVGNALKGVGAFIKDITPGVRGFVKGLTEGFNTMKPVITQFLKNWGAVLGDAGSSEGVWLRVGRGLAYIAGAVVIVVEAVLSAIGMVLYLGAVLVGSFMGAVGIAQEGFAAFGSAISSAWQAVKAIFSGEGPSIGTFLSEGIANGLNIDVVVAKIQGMGSAMIAAIKAVLLVKSPSRVFEEIGGYTSEGMAIGIDRGSGAAAKASRRMGASVAAAGSEGAMGGRVPSAANDGAEGGAGGEGIHVHVHVQVRDGASAQEQGQAAGNAAAKEIRGMLRRVAVRGR